MLSLSGDLLEVLNGDTVPLQHGVKRHTCPFREYLNRNYIVRDDHNGR